MRKFDLYAFCSDFISGTEGVRWFIASWVGVQPWQGPLPPPRVCFSPRDRPPFGRKKNGSPSSKDRKTNLRPVTLESRNQPLTSLLPNLGQESFAEGSG